jgi:hypothetical protein
MRLNLLDYLINIVINEGAGVVEYLKTVVVVARKL